MNHGKVLLIAAICSSLVACSNNPKKEEEGEGKNSPLSLYELPETIDLQKAARINIELGLSYLKQEQVSRAKTKFLRAQSLAPELPEVHYSYGYFQEYVGDIEEAKKSYVKAISIDPKAGNSHNNYGAFLCRQQKYQDAEKEFMKAVSDPNYTNNGEAWENAGLCVLPTKDIAKATEYFEKALRNDPNRVNSLLELAIIKFQDKKIPEAKDYYNRFTQYSKPNERSLLLGIELARLGNDQINEVKYRRMLRAHYPNAKPSDLFNRSMHT